MLHIFIVKYTAIALRLCTAVYKAMASGNMDRFKVASYNARSVVKKGKAELWGKTKKARQCLFFLKRLKDFHLSLKVLKNIYSYSIQSI